MLGVGSLIPNNEGPGASVQMEAKLLKSSCNSVNHKFH